MCLKLFGPIKHTTKHTTNKMSTFKSRKQLEALVGRKRLKTVRFQDAERRQCAKIVLPDTQGITSLVEAYKAKCRDDNFDQWTMWHLQLKMAKELATIAAKVLKFLDQVADLEELSMDTETGMIPLIDEMISECQDTLLEANTPEHEEKTWTRDTDRDKTTDKMLDAAIATMNKVVGTVFKSKEWLKTEERYDLLHACCALFQASENLVKSVIGDGEHLVLEEQLESMFDEAISKCDDQTLDEYLDVDCDHEEEELEEDEDEDED